MNNPQENTPPPSDFPSGLDLTGDPKLIAEGWEFRFVAESARAQEAVELYTELGYEVRTEPARSEGLKEECNGCRSAFCDFFMIYTRKGVGS